MTCPYCGFTQIGIEFGFISSCSNCTRYFLNEAASKLDSEERRVLEKFVANMNAHAKYKKDEKDIKRLIGVAEKLDWSVDLITDIRDKSWYIEFEKYSPAGEDFIFGIEATTAKDFIDGIKERYWSYIPDDHVEELVIAKHNGLKDVPPLSILVDDSSKIDEMLLELKDALIDEYDKMQEEEGDD